MAHTNVRNTFVGKPTVIGGIWRYDLATIAPTGPGTPRPAGGVYMGGVSEDGFSYSSERQREKKRDWNGDTVRSPQTSKDDTFEVTFIEFLNPNVLEVIHGEDNVNVTPATALSGSIIEVTDNADDTPHYAYLVETFDGKVKRRRWIYDAQAEGLGDPIVEKPGDWSVYKLKFQMVPGLPGATNRHWTMLDDKLAEKTFTVTFTGTATAGDFELTVGADTATIPYNVTSANFKSLLEALPSVGTGNATVTGSTGGPFTVKLTLPAAVGVSLDDSGLTGATVEIAPA